MNHHIRSNISVLGGLYLLAMTVRLAAFSWLGVHAPPTSDEIEYFEPAASLAEGKGYVMIPQQADDQIARPSAYRMPGPALILAAALRGFGPYHSVARVACILFASLSAPLTFSLTCRFASRRTGLLAGIACAFYPSWVYYSQEILSEPFFIPALLLALVLSSEIRQSGTWIALGAGLAWGLATLMRPHALPIGVAVALLVGLEGTKREGTLILLGITLTLSPWLVRNCVVVGHPILLATESGETFLGSNNPEVYETSTLRGMWLSPMAVPSYRQQLKPIRDEVERSQQQMAIGLKFLGRDPQVIPVLILNKWLRWLTPITGSKGMVRYLVLLSYLPLLALLCYGAMTRSFASNRPLTFVTVCSVVFAGITAVYWGGLVRGRLPLEVIWLPWGAVAFGRLMGWEGRSRHDSVGGSGSRSSTIE